MEENEKKISKLSDYIKIVEELPEGFDISRGQSNKSYKLLPSGLRENQQSKKIYSKRDVSFFLEEFKINSHIYLNSHNSELKEIDWMIEAQHYGIPTKLLDFTYSHIISLMFAVSDSFEETDSSDAVVYFLNPSKLNLLSKDHSKIININTDKISDIENYDHPIAIKSSKKNTRIQSQNGVFVYFPYGCKELNDDEYQECLQKVVIDKNYKKSILKSLYNIGVSLMTLYPELPFVSKDIILKRNLSQYNEEDE